MTKYKIETEHGIFESNEVMNRTAEGVYQKWLEDKDKPVINEPTFEELQTEYNVDLDYRVSLIEMGL